MTEKKEVNPETGELIEDYEKMFEINTAEYDGREEIVIDFKDGQRLLLKDVGRLMDESKTASQPVLGKESARQVLKFLKQKNPTKEEFIKHFKSKGLNRGGAMLGEQTEMAFMQEGGLKDDGMDRDPISGNEVPSGSLAEEVRDDIPAQLSEGEYVVPADVVRFFGIKFFEDLRMQAKMGLNQMERSGRIGGEPIAVEVKASEETLDPKDEEKIRDMLQGFSEGAVVTDKDFEEDATKKAFDPRKYSIPGFSYIRSKKDDGPTNDEILSGTKDGEITYYHPDGQERKVKYVDGEIVNEDDVKFTQPPWSLTKPKASKDTDVSETSPRVGIEDRDSDSDREDDSYYGQSLISNFEDVAPAKGVSTEDLARQYGGEALYYDEEGTNPIKMTDAAYQGLVSDYNRLGLAEEGVSFKDWYNTPTLTKISMSFNKLMGYDPSKEDIELALQNAKRQPNLFKSGILGYLRSFIYDRTEAKSAKGKKDLEKLTKPTKSRLDLLLEAPSTGAELKNPIYATGSVTEDPLTGQRAKRLTKKDLEDYRNDIAKGTILGDTGIGRRITNFMQGFQKADDNIIKEMEKAGYKDVKKDDPVVFGTDASGKQGYKPVTDKTLSDMEKNRKNVEKADRARQDTFMQTGDAFAADRAFHESFTGFDSSGNFTGVTDPGTAAMNRFKKGGLASKPKAKVKRKRNTKGLGTKPKAT